MRGCVCKVLFWIGILWMIIVSLIFLISKFYESATFSFFLLVFFFFNIPAWILMIVAVSKWNSEKEILLKGMKKSTCKLLLGFGMFWIALISIVFLATGYYTGPQIGIVLFLFFVLNIPAWVLIVIAVLNWSSGYAKKIEEKKLEPGKTKVKVKGKKKE